MGYFLSIISSLVILITCSSHVKGKIKCLQSYNPHSTHEPILIECPVDNDSCVKFYYNGNVIPRYGCLSKLENISPEFSSIECAKTQQTATCFTASTGESGHRMFLHRIKNFSFTYVLHRADISSFCCCQNDVCNNNNEQMETHFLRIDKAINKYEHVTAPDSYLKHVSMAASLPITVSLSIYFTIAIILYAAI